MTLSRYFFCITTQWESLIFSWARGKLKKLIKLANITAQLRGRPLMFPSCAMKSLLFMCICMLRFLLQSDTVTGCGLVERIQIQICMKLVTTKSVDFFEELSCDLWKETLRLSFSNVFTWHVEQHKLSAIYFHYIGEKAQLISSKLCSSQQNHLEGYLQHLQHYW